MVLGQSPPCRSTHCGPVHIAPKCDARFKKRAVALLRGLPLESQIQSFNFFSGPGGSSQKLQAGFDTRVIIKTPYADDSPHLIPTVTFNKLGQYHFQSDPVKRIFGCLINHVSTCPVDTSFFQRRFSLRLPKNIVPFIGFGIGLSAKVLVD
jgi:hypothetical protein